MTEKLYLQDAYRFEHVATVQAVDGCSVILDRTCMYPGGGGQPPDCGEIELDSGPRLGVISVFKDDAGRILHQCADPAPEDIVGATCRVRLDQARRLGLMRYHTALHVFNTVMLRVFNGWITGVSIGPDGSHIDFKLDDYNEDMVRRLEDEVNAVLARNLPITAHYVSEDEFRGRPDLLRTLEAKPPIENGRVRVVATEGFEEQACGGTHVHNTSEVGRLSITKVRSKGRFNRRFYVTLSACAAV
jgi:misacylated tRNA(Ala) deacylase